MTSTNSNNFYISQHAYNLIINYAQIKGRDEERKIKGIKEIRTRESAVPFLVRKPKSQLKPNNASFADE